MSNHLRPACSVNETRYKSSTIAPYYNQKYGHWLKVILDRLLATEEKKVEYKFYTKDFGKALRTLQLQVNQAWQWLIDNDTDTDQRYLKLREKIIVAQERGNKDEKSGGIRLAWRGGEEILADAKEVEAKNFKWKKKFTEYLETAQEMEVWEKRLTLEEADIDWVKDQVMILPQFHVLKLDEDGIKIVMNTEMGKEKQKIQAALEIIEDEGDKVD